MGHQEHTHTSYVSVMYRCLACPRSWTNEVHLRNHHRAQPQHRLNVSPPEANVAPPTQKTRKKKYNYDFKMKTLQEFEDQLGAGADRSAAMKQTSARREVNIRVLRRWVKNHESIFALAQVKKISRFCKYRPSGGRYPEAEEMLFQAFVLRRRKTRLGTRRANKLTCPLAE